MDEDEDNDERNEDQEEDENIMRSYSKKKLFGKTTREIKPLTLRTHFKPKHQLLKPFKITLEDNVGKIMPPSQSTLACKVKHQDSYGALKVKSKFNLNLRNHWQFQNYDFGNILSTNVFNTTLALSTKINSKNQLGCKASHTIKFWDCWKLKYALEWEKKRDSVTGGTINLEKKWNGQLPPRWMRFASQYNEVLGVGLSGKFNLRKKVQAFYKGHITTNENNKFYLQHKLGYDWSSATPLSNSFTLNCQDSLGIGTLNGSISFQNTVLKNKQFRFVIEFEKSLAFGVQRRNDIFQFMMQKSKIKWNWLKNFRVNVGNRGLVSSIEGKINLFRTAVDYSLTYKLKQIQNNFYEDSSLGFSFKWNL